MTDMTLRQILENMQMIANVISDQNASYELQKLISKARDEINSCQREQVTTHSRKPGYEIHVDGDYRFLFDPIKRPVNERPEIEDVGSDIRYEDVVDIAPYQRSWEQRKELGMIE